MVVCDMPSCEATLDEHKNLRRFGKSWSARVSAKTASLAGIVENAEQIGGTLHEEWFVISRKCLQRAKFAAWSGRNRVLDAYFRKSKHAGGTAQVYIAAGNASFASSAPGAPPAPTRRVEQKMIMYFGKSHVKPVDMWHTTMMDNASHKRLHNVVRLKGIEGNSSEGRPGLTLSRHS
jgi:hypothetical protein